MFPASFSGSLSGYGCGYSDDPLVKVDEQELPLEAMQSVRFTAHTAAPGGAASLGVLKKRLFLGHFNL